MRRRPYLSWMRLLLVLVLVVGTSLAVLPAAQAFHKPCPTGYTHVPTDDVPQGVDGNNDGDVDDGPLNGDVKVTGGEPTCAQPIRTIVFVGTTEIDNGINFNGVAVPSGGPGANPSAPFADVQTAFDAFDTEGPDGGGHYLYTGFCIMVDWVNQDGAAGPDILGVSNSCTFQNTPGIYGPSNSTFPVFGPDAADPNFSRANNQGDFDRGVWAWTTADGSDPQTCNWSSGSGQSSTGSACSPAAHNPLGFAPPGQTGCVGGTDGFGVSTFTAKTTNDEGGGSVDTIVSKYYWDNSLNNFRGYITDDIAQPSKWVFDAKIRVDPDPAGITKSGVNDPAESNAAGCLEKFAAQNGVTIGAHAPARTGLNFLLVVGTASWNFEVVSEHIPVV